MHVSFDCAGPARIRQTMDGVVHKLCMDMDSRPPTNHGLTTGLYWMGGGGEGEIYSLRRGLDGSFL